MRVAAQWTYSKEHFSGHDDPAWLGIGFGVSDAGLLVLLAALGLAYRLDAQTPPVGSSGAGRRSVRSISCCWPSRGSR